MASKLIAPALAVGAALLGLAAASFWFTPQQTPAVSSGTLLPQPRLLTDFSLQGANGQAFTKAQLQGRWTLVFAGFTRCPDVCPDTLARLKQLDANLRQRGVVINVLLLSIDPQRDQPEQLASYVHYFNPDFLAATAQEPELARVTRELGIAYAKVPGKTADDYTMDHSAALVLLDPQVRVAGYFTPPLRVEALTTDLAQLIAH